LVKKILIITIIGWYPKVRQVPPSGCAGHHCELFPYITDLLVWVLDNDGNTYHKELRTVEIPHGYCAYAY